MRARDYYVYIMTGRCGLFYTGVTNDLVRRLLQHKAGLAGFTARYQLTRLVYYESTADIRDAIAREKQVKPWRREKKLWLIRQMNPLLLDLSHEILSQALAGGDVCERGDALRRSLHCAALRSG